jgi:hypothetical protein
VNGGGGRKPNNFSQTLPDQHGDELAVMHSDRQEEEEGEGEEPAAPPPPRPKRTGARPKRTEPTLDRKVLADH